MQSIRRLVRWTEESRRLLGSPKQKQNIHVLNVGLRLLATFTRSKESKQNCSESSCSSHQPL